MILAVLGLGAIGLWFLIAGDGAGRLVGLFMIAMAGLFAFLLWVAIEVERPTPGATSPAEATDD
jgi:cation transporter-like permease